MAHMLHYFLPRNDYGYWHCHVFPLVISYQCLLRWVPGSRNTRGRAGGGGRHSERYHGRLNGCKLQGHRRVCGYVSLMWLIRLCVMSMIGGLTVEALTECQSHFGPTALLSVWSLAWGASNASIIHAESDKEKKKEKQSRRHGACETY